MTHNLSRTKWTNQYGFQTYGVKLGLRSNDDEIFQNLKDRLPFLFPNGHSELDFGRADHIFSLVRDRKKEPTITVYKDEDQISTIDLANVKFDSVDSKIRLTVAEFAEGFVFLHAGAVSYKGRGIIIPARSFSGKTTLVAELVKHGLEYYSDEYAVIDSDGLLHPYPKQLSMRGIINDYEQLDIDVEDMGGSKGEEIIEIGAIFIGKYKKKSRFCPKLASSGEGVIESIANSVSIRQNPEFVLGVLGKVVNRALIVKTNRGEAKDFVSKFLTFLDNNDY